MSGGIGSAELELRDSYPAFLPMRPLPLDAAQASQLSSVVYYACFEALIADFLVARGGLDLAASPMIGISTESRCRFLAPIRLPAPMEGGLRVARVTDRSYTLEVGLFPEGMRSALAVGRFTHLWVERSNCRPASIPAEIRRALEAVLAA